MFINDEKAEILFNSVIEKRIGLKEFQDALNSIYDTLTDELLKEQLELIDKDNKKKANDFNHIVNILKAEEDKKNISLYCEYKKQTDLLKDKKTAQEEYKFKLFKTLMEDAFNKLSPQAQENIKLLSK